MTAKRVNLFGSSVPLPIVLGLGAGFLLVTLLSVAYLWFAGYFGSSGFAGMEFMEARPAQDFQLTDYRGQPFRLSDHRGKVVFLYFGYTMCPDACPTTMLDYRRTVEALGKKADQLVIAFVTVDPERDTAAVLANYMKSRGDDRFYALIGSEAELAPILQAYNVFAEKVKSSDSGIDYWVNHTALSYVIDTRGNLRLAHPFGMNYEAMLHDTQLLLREGK